MGSPVREFPRCLRHQCRCEEKSPTTVLHFAGPIVHDIYETTLSPATIGENYADTLKVLNDYFLPKKNVEFEIYKFRKTKHEVNESLARTTQK